MKLFPIIAEYGVGVKQRTTDYIPYAVIKSHEEQALVNHGQSLQRLAERGGLSYNEALAVLEDRRWTDIEQTVAKHKVYSIMQAFDCVN